MPPAARLPAGTITVTSGTPPPLPGISPLQQMACGLPGTGNPGLHFPPTASRHAARSENLRHPDAVHFVNDPSNPLNPGHADQPSESGVVAVTLCGLSAEKTRTDRTRAGPAPRHRALQYERQPSDGRCEHMRRPGLGFWQTPIVLSLHAVVLLRSDVWSAHDHGFVAAAHEPRTGWTRDIFALRSRSAHRLGYWPAARRAVADRLGTGGRCASAGSLFAGLFAMATAATPAVLFSARAR